MAIHTILGAGGTISNELVPVLISNKEQVRLVSRKGKEYPGAESVKADLTNYQQVLDAVKGSGIVYLLAGLEYKITVWRQQWPVIMRNVINACKETGSKLIFFDNVYMYGKVDGAMTEETPFNPNSKKGEVRVAIATMLLDEIKAGNITAMIARSADFYGPRATQTSVAGVLVFDKLWKGSTAQWMANANMPHSFTYTPDAGKALYLLAVRNEAFGQTWHLPTAAPAPTGKEFIALAAEAMHAKNKVQVAPKWLLKFMGLFNPMMKELGEMLYQNEFPYIFDSSKFNKAFNFTPTTYQKGISETAEWFLKQPAAGKA